RKLEGWLSVFGKPVYLVVGVLVAEDGEATDKMSSSTTRGGNVSVPLVDIAMAGVGIPMPVSFGGVGVDADRTREGGMNIRGVSEGNQIFVMEYKLLKRHIWSLSGKVEDKG